MANGSWTYALNNADPDTNALTQGQIVTDAFSYTVSDTLGATSSAALTITITGTNDAPVAVADGNGGDAVTESGIVAGDPSATGNVLTNDTDPDTGDTKTVTAVNGSALNVGVLVAGIYGTLTLGANGSWTYALNDADPDTNALAQGQAATDAFTYTVTDANGATSSTALTIAITGANDAPVAVDDSNGSDLVIESGDQPRQYAVCRRSVGLRQLLTNDTDPDSGDTRTVTAVERLGARRRAYLFTGTFGTFISIADGSWTYTLDNNDDDTEALARAQIGLESVAYTITDANGANSSATLLITHPAPMTRRSRSRMTTTAKS